MRRTCELVVGEMREPDHPKAGRVQPIQRLDLPVQRLRAFDPQPAGDHLPIGAPFVDEALHVGGRANESKRSAGALRQPIELGGLIERTRRQRSPCCDGPQTHQRNLDDLIGLR